MEEMKVMDVFSLMLVEASGDSEAGVDAEEENAMDVAEDDAQSCSCEMVDHDCFESEDEEDDDDFADIHHQDQYHDYYGGDDDDGGGGEECDSGGGGGVMAAMSGTGKSGQGMKKAKACVDSAMELVNEREKSKLFWEACLAS